MMSSAPASSSLPSITLVPVRVVGGSYSTYFGQLYLQRVADLTGGQAYYIGFRAPAVAFAPYLSDLSDRLNRQYLLSFLAEPEKKDRLEPVKVISEVPNTELVAAHRVYVQTER